eukprot:scaffold7507_cov56-Phaeocystis_antarctica.AAC.3
MPPLGRRCGSAKPNLPRSSASTSRRAPPPSVPTPPAATLFERSPSADGSKSVYTAWHGMCVRARPEALGGVARVEEDRAVYTAWTKAGNMDGSLEHPRRWLVAQRSGLSLGVPSRPEEAQEPSWGAAQRAL